LFSSDLPLKEEISMTFESSEKKKTTPTIFYGTRTHSQIKQIVRELKKTSFKPSNFYFKVNFSYGYFGEQETLLHSS
jgi:hypothetical protein